MLAETGERRRHGDHVRFQGHAAIGRSRPRLAERDADGAAVAGGLGLGLGEERVELARGFAKLAGVVVRGEERESAGQHRDHDDDRHQEFDEGEAAAGGTRAEG